MRPFSTSSALRFIACLTVFAPLGFCQHLRAQGVLVESRGGAHLRLPRPIWPGRPQPEQATTYRIASMEIDARLRNGVAQVQVSQAFENTGHSVLEAQFVFPLPYDGAVDQLTLLVDGKEYAAQLLPAKDARKRYEDIVRASRDPALLEWVGSGMFQTSVFPIPAGATRTVTLRYSQVCRTSQGLTDFIFPLSTAKYTTGALDKLTIRVAIEGAANIKNVYSPTHPIDVERPDGRHALVKLNKEKTIPSEDFRLFFDTGKSAVAASVISYRPDGDELGYFMLLATPQIEQSATELRVAKTVVFAVDRSGSMSGEKMDQAKEAAKFVLNNLREGDAFNIVAYDSEVESFRPELERYTEDTRQAAIGFINGLYAGGSTNIDGALKRSLGMLTDEKRPSFVIFLTDGLPTIGETNEAKIANNAEAANQAHGRVFTFGVGYDVNSRLLDKLARAGRGQSEFVRPDEDIEAAVSALYRRIGAPVMTDARLDVDVEGANVADGPTVSQMYPGGPFDLFAGDQAVFLGRYRAAGAVNVRLSGVVAGEKQAFQFPAELAASSADDANAFIARLWAARRVGEIIDELDLQGRNDELVKELVDLATKHGILTPYTSFLADDSATPRDRERSFESAADGLRRLDIAEGAAGVQQRGVKQLFRSAGDPNSNSAYGGPAGLGAESAASAPASGELASRSGVPYYDADKDTVVVAENMIVVGRKTFFRRDDRWVDSRVDEAQEKNAIRIERFSQAYFDLIAKHGKFVAPYLAIEDPVVIELAGQAYSW